MWGEVSVCTVGLRWSEERWDMSMCAAVHMKATWRSQARWFMPLITTTQRCFQQQQSSAEGWQQWDTCQSGDEKMSLLGGCVLCNFDIYFFFCLFVSIRLWISYEGLLMRQNVKWSHFPSLTECLPPPVRRRQWASPPRLWLISWLISAGLSFSLSVTGKNKHILCDFFFCSVTFYTLNLPCYFFFFF